LSGCGNSAIATRQTYTTADAAIPKKQEKNVLPDMPADMKTCVRRVVSPTLEDRDLTVEEVEALLKQYEVVTAKLRVCGERPVQWFADLRKRWR